MNNLVINRTPEIIAAEINSIKDQTRNIVLNSSIEIGRRLVEAKELVTYGEWGNWLEEKVDYSQRTAQNLMKIFNEYGSSQLSLLGDNAKTQALADLTYTQAVALLGIEDAEEREKFVEENNVKEMSTRELQQAIKERDQAKKNLEEVRDLLKNKSDESLKFYNEKIEIENQSRLTDSTLKETRSTMTKLQEALEEKKNELKELESRHELLLGEQITVENNEELEKLKGEIKDREAKLGESKEKIKELEEQLNVMPEPVIVEKVPEAIEKELEELRKKAQASGTDIKVKFKVHFDILVKGFNDLLEDLDEIDKESEIYEKFRNAIHGLIDGIVERL